MHGKHEQHLNHAWGLVGMGLKIHEYIKTLWPHPLPLSRGLKCLCQPLMLIFLHIFFNAHICFFLRYTNTGITTHVQIQPTECASTNTISYHGCIVKIQENIAGRFLYSRRAKPAGNTEICRQYFLYFDNTTMITILSIDYGYM